MLQCKSLDETSFPSGAGAATGGLRFTGTTDATSNRVINLAGTTGGAIIGNSTAVTAKLVLTGNVTATGIGDKTLTLTGNSGADNEIGGAIPNIAGFKTSLVKEGPGKWILSGANTYTGKTSVHADTLVITNPVLDDTADVRVSADSALNLPYSGTDVVGHLVIDGLFHHPPHSHSRPPLCRAAESHAALRPHSPPFQAQRPLHGCGRKNKEYASIFSAMFGRAWNESHISKSRCPCCRETAEDGATCHVNRLATL